MSPRERADIGLTARIHEIYRRSRETYGSPNIHAELADDHGIHVGRKRVARLMRAAGLRGATLRKFVVTTERGAQSSPVTDLVERRFYAERPNRLWVADATYIPTWSGFLYLAIVLDVFSRKIVGWAMETHLRTELMLAAIDMAITMRRPREAIHHSDHGCQYTSYAFGKRCQERASCPRWVRWAMRTTTRWRRASSRLSSANAQPPALQEPGRGEDGDLRLAGRLVQPASSTLRVGLSLAGQLRAPCAAERGGISTRPPSSQRPIRRAITVAGTHDHRS